MAGNRQGEQTRERILDAALLEFIEQGFDGARVEDIAKRAGLTKVMLYYHFSTKENMMAELMARVSCEIAAKFRENMAGMDIEDPQSVRRQVEAMEAYFSGKKAILRLIISESFKGNIGSFSVFDDLFKVIESATGGGPEAGRRQQFLVRMFFFNTLPMVMYTSLSDHFNDDFGLDRDVSRQVFLDTFIDVFYGNLVE